MSWVYSPAALSIEVDKSRRFISATFLGYKGNPEIGYFVAASPMLRSNSRSKIRATLESLITPDRIAWVTVQVVAVRTVSVTTKFLAQFSDSYTVHPSSKVTISILKAVNRGSRKSLKASLSQLTPFTAVAPQRGFSRVKIHSSPFAGVNPAVFLGYWTHGTITHNNRYVMLCDTRFLDGMNGGIAFLDGPENQSIGLVVGSLVKSNGEGSLTIIVPWAQIAKELESISIKAPALTASKASGVESVSMSDFHGVVALLVKRQIGPAMIWGSGVLVSPDTIVTNAHVIEENPHGVTAWFSERHSVPLQFASIPFKGLDLAVLKLKHPVRNYAFVPLSASTVSPGDPVKSIGFGMFYPHNLGVRPLLSTGHVSKVVKMPLQTESTTPSPALLVCSSGCWNGSSGGAVLNARGELVGIMASNGKVDTGEIIPTMTFVIPVDLIRQALVMQDTEFAEISPRVQDLWQLEATHSEEFDPPVIKAKL
ncbi:hypothetical protein TRVA0_033S00408 [Trichomonascus vanleenenianus]|uniref:S1 family peptidase n=1 Tax=Trichomonascus vanleenenianus TaxID=2268995 RepID=UPI003ECB00E2